MRDLKKATNKTINVRPNKRKKQPRKVDLRRLLHRSLRVGVALFTLGLLAVSGFLAVQLLLVSDLFRLEDVNVRGNQRLPAEEIVARSNIRSGQNTFKLDLELIGRKIAENPWVAEVRVQRIFPRRIEISIVEHEPVAIVNLGYLYYLDNRGEIFKVLEAQDSLDYPVITGFDHERARHHDKVYASRLREIVELLDNLEQRTLFSQAQVSEVHHDPTGNLTLYTLQDGVRIKLGRTGFQRKLDRLERIYAQLRPQLEMLDYIDLNVEEKVIVRIERPQNAAKG